MAGKSDPNGYPTVSSRIDFTELDILDLDLDWIFRPGQVWIWILGIRIETRHPIRTQNPKKFKYLFFLS